VTPEDRFQTERFRRHEARDAEWERLMAELRELQSKPRSREFDMTRKLSGPQAANQYE
jgi:hypothetical protein